MAMKTMTKFIMMVAAAVRVIDTNNYFAKSGNDSHFLTLLLFLYHLALHWTQQSATDTSDYTELVSGAEIIAFVAGDETKSKVCKDIYKIPGWL